MARFEYVAQLQSGAEITGALEASDAEDAVAQLNRLSLSNVNVNPAEAPASPRRIKGADFIFFNEQLASMAQAGVGLESGLRQLADDVGSSRLRGMLNDVAEALDRGVSLDDALAARGAAMPALYHRVVRAGLKTGQLPATLLNLAAHLRSTAQTKRAVFHALAYPATVLVLVLGLFTGVILLLIPQFAEIYADFDMALPQITLMMFGLGRIMPSILVLAGGALLAIMIAMIVARRSSRYGLAWERLLLAMPLLGSLLRDSIRAQFLRAMSFAVRSGLPLEEGVLLAADAAASPTIRRDATDIAQRIESGGSALEACRSCVVVPPILGYVLQVCAERGGAEDALVQLSSAYEARAQQARALMQVWLMPMGILLVGVLVGMCVVSMFLPMINLIESVS
jgi:type II secretory pathway component PulF